MTPIEIIITSIGGSAVLFGALSYLAKSIISQLLTKDIENHKTKLKFESDLELEKFKSELEKTAFEHQTRFSKLHDKRAEIIAELYSRIVDLYNTVKIFVGMALVDDGEEQKKKITKELWETVDHYRDYFQKHKIFLEVELCKKIEELDESMSAPVSKLMMHMKMSSQNDNYSPLFEAWEEAEEKIESLVSEIKNEIENEFRTLLGVIEK